MEWHKNPEDFKYKICDKSFLLKKSLDEHIKAHESGHYGDRIYKCSSCKYTTRVAENLQKHELKHKRKEENNEKTKNWLQCEKCPMKLKNKLKLAAHNYKKHNEDNE